MYLQDCFVEHAPWMGDMRPGTIVRKIMEASGAGTKKSLPQTVVNLTGEICQKALAEKTRHNC